MFDSICTLGFDEEQVELLQTLVDQAQMPPRLPFTRLLVGEDLPEDLKAGRSLLLWKVRSAVDAPVSSLESTKWLLGVFRCKPPWMVVTDPPAPAVQAICQVAAAFGIFVPQPGDPEIIRNAILHLRLLSPTWQGRLTIPKILRLVHLWRGTIGLKISVEPKHRGTITIRDGEVLAANTSEGHTGLEALREILSWPDGSMATVSPSAVEQNITMPSRELLVPDEFDRILGRQAKARETQNETTSDQNAAGSIASTVDQACANVLENVNGALACWVVDLRSGLLTGAQYMNSYFTQDYVDSVAAIALRTFNSPATARIQQLLGSAQGGASRLQDAYFATDQVSQYMHPICDKRAVVVLVTRKSADEEAGWAYLRNALPSIQATFDPACSN